MNIEGLKIYLKRKNIKYEQLANMTNLSISTIKKLMSGVARYPRVATIQAIERALGVTITDLDLPEDARIKAIGGFPVEDKYRIAIVGKVVAGKPIESQEYIEGYLSIDYANPQEYFALRVSGDSMRDIGITPGSLLIVHKQQQVENGEIIVASIDGESTVKRYKEDKGVIFLMPENSAYNPIVVSEENDFYIFGKVVEVRFNV